MSHDDLNAYASNGSTMTFVLLIVICYSSTKLHVLNVLNNGDTNIKSGFKCFTCSLADIHC